MRLQSLLTVVIALLISAVAVRADCTNEPKTQLEALECRTGAVLIKGLGNVGTLEADGRSVEVTCLAYADPTTNTKKYGLRIRIQANNALITQALLDFDELNPLLKAIDTISQVDRKKIGLPNYEAVFRTRDELRILTRNAVDGAIESVQASIGRAGTPHVHLTLQQLSQFKDLLTQSRDLIESLQKNKEE